MESLRILLLLLYKNYIVRKRSWKRGLFVETLIPILLFLMAQATLLTSGDPPKNIPNNTYYEIKTKNDLQQNLHFKRVFYVPQNRMTKLVMDKTQRCLGLPSGNLMGFATEAEMLNKYALLHSPDGMVDIIAIVFDNAGSKQSTKQLEYTVRSPVKIPMDLYKPNNEISVADNTAWFMEIVPFVLVQMCIDESFINVTSTSAPKTELSIQQLPYPPHIQTSDNEMAKLMFCTVALMAFVIPLCIEATFAADEKFIGVNILMLMNGVPTILNLLSWLIAGLIFSLLYIVPIIIILCTSLSSGMQPYLYYGNGFVVAIILMLHVGHLISFGMHVAAYFSKSSYMTTAILVLFVGSNVMQKYIIKDDVYVVIPYLGIIFPNLLIYRTFEEISNHESMLTGIRWSTLFTIGEPAYTIAGSPGMVMLFAIIGSCIHFMFANYIYSVLPGKYGVPKHPLFFLKRDNTRNQIFDKDVEGLSYEDNNGKPFEKVSSAVYTPGVQIRNLKKEYSTSLFGKSTVQALRGVSLDFYKGQITALLGHNGAGKTTMMSILCGMMSPSSGTVLINGQNVQDKQGYRIQDMGLCPQENMLFPSLNVTEQLLFFGMLKNRGKTKVQMRRDVIDLLRKLKLYEKRDSLPSTLSGGQKRRTCLGMAVIGDSSILILDEPTSGMDPQSRRDTWDIILKIRGDKTILMSTHDMEEADILGDRIAIIHMGLLRSYGSAMYLKKFVGQGNMEVTLSTESWCIPENVRNVIDPRGQVLSVDGGKVVLTIPYSDELADSLDKVELEKKELGITGMSVSLITLEQVFLKVTRDTDDTDSYQRFVDSTQKLQGFQLKKQAALALFSKKITYTLRNKSTTLIILCLPILCILLMTLDNIPPPGEVKTHFKVSMYPRPVTMVTSEDPLLGMKYRLTSQEFGGQVIVPNSSISLTESLLDFGRKDLVTYRNNFLAAAEFNVTGNLIKANALYSKTAMLSIPIAMNLLSNALLRNAAGDDYSISISFQPLPIGLDPIQARLNAEIDAAGTSLVFVFFIFPAAALFVIHPLREYVTGIKQLQRMCGISGIMYWFAIFIFDFVIFMAMICLILIGFIIMDVILDLRIYYVTELAISALILVLFALNALPIVYIFSFLNKSVGNVISMLNYLPLGFVAVDLIMDVLRLAHDTHFVRTLRAIQSYIFLFIPYVSFYQSEVSFHTTANKNAMCRKLPEIFINVACLTEKDICCGLECANGSCKKHKPYFEDDGGISLKNSIIYLGVTPLLYFGILALLEYKVIPLLIMRLRKNRPLFKIDDYDEQVKNEKRAIAHEIGKMKGRHSTQIQNGRVTLAATHPENHTENPPANGNGADGVINGKPSSYLFLVYELSKTYRHVLAVEEVSFSVKQHECFGLLGVNGAGKSTTFRMLTGEDVPDSGTMYLANKNIRTHRNEYLMQMGYCPQNDAIIRSLNAKDHLQLFALLRGIPKMRVQSEVKKWIDRLNLNLCANQPSGTYSGGNKRRLNIAISLIGNPNLVLMDEPTTGVDPAARRSLWNVIQSCQAGGQAVILTSHSMEECETLCNRLAIMVGGRLVCIGPSQELKQRFGAGFIIQMKLNPEWSGPQIDGIKRDFENSLTCEIVDQNMGFIMYHVTNGATKWRQMYDVMKELQATYNSIDDFCVLSATLEQLFLQFARAARH